MLKRYDAGKCDGLFSRCVLLENLDQLSSFLSSTFAQFEFIFPNLKTRVFKLIALKLLFATNYFISFAGLAVWTADAAPTLGAVSSRAAVPRQW